MHKEETLIKEKKYTNDLLTAKQLTELYHSFLSKTAPLGLTSVLISHILAFILVGLENLHLLNKNQAINSLALMMLVVIIVITIFLLNSLILYCRLIRKLRNMQDMYDFNKNHYLKRNDIKKNWLWDILTWKLDHE
ncbi:hypothetical protein [Tenacibaculum agarivorans]|uniref:hypothetical protein n=1 Tax=Tenacibaculum agarivorans TaxID=1908389 RepID=UPI00094BC0DE|nr:hypothetical protein [Tenacibaculum agarivorans]